MSLSRIAPTLTHTPEQQTFIHHGSISDHDHAHYQRSPIHGRRSFISPASSEESKLKFTKAFQQILEARNPDFYDGRSPAKYRTWKLALEREVFHLGELSATQWLNLLKSRTKGEAREAVDRACDVLEETSPEQTLETAWKFLDQQFQTPWKPSQEILARLQQWPITPTSNPKQLLSRSK